MKRKFAYLIIITLLFNLFSINVTPQNSKADSSGENDFELKSFVETDLYTVDRPNDIETLSNQDKGQILTQVITECGKSKTTYLKFNVKERGWVWIDSTANSDYAGHGNSITLYANESLSKIIKSNYTPSNKVMERLSAYYLDSGTYYLEVTLAKYFANDDPKELRQIVYGYFMPSSKILAAQLNSSNNSAKISCSSEMTDAVYNWAYDKSVVSVINDTKNFYKNISVVSSFEIDNNGVYSIRSSSEASEWKNYPVDIQITVDEVAGSTTSNIQTGNISKKTYSKSECNLFQINTPGDVDKEINKGNGELIRQKVLETRQEKTGYVEINVPERGWVWIDATSNTDYAGHQSEITLYSNSGLTKEVNYKYAPLNEVAERQKAFYVEAGTYYLKAYLYKYFANGSPAELRQVVSGFFLPASNVISVKSTNKEHEALLKCSSSTSLPLYYWAKDVSTVDHIYDTNSFYKKTSDSDEIVVKENGDYSIKIKSALYEWSHYPFDAHISVSGIIETPGEQTETTSGVESQTTAPSNHTPDSNDSTEESTTNKQNVSPTPTTAYNNEPANKSNQYIVVKAKTKKVKYSKIKKRKKSVKKLISVNNYVGTITYTKMKKSSKNLSINRKTGVIYIKKGSKRGTYKIKVKVTASGNSMYLSASKVVTVKIKVK